MAGALGTAVTVRITGPKHRPWLPTVFDEIPENAQIRPKCHDFPRLPSASARNEIVVRRFSTRRPWSAGRGPCKMQNVSHNDRESSGEWPDGRRLDRRRDRSRNAASAINPRQELHGPVISRDRQGVGPFVA